MTHLADFLATELEIAQTMLNVAATEYEHPTDPDGAAKAIQNAQKALAIVRVFLPQLRRAGSADQANQIEQEAAKIQAAIDIAVAAH